MQKKILIISRHAPYGSSIAREAIDVALAGTVYDQNISYLFMDDGVFQLLKNQRSQKIDQKDISATLKALSIYGIENIYVHEESLKERGIITDELILDSLRLLNSKNVAALLTEQDQLMSF
ncbi:sulfurtransferase complex subunit TusC [Cellvibrio sp. UBA7661]|uniref:sulfurtransferase complex subunit TusC n=1 Tax=Cellvibrio sp. UBA7661 TaxID=1946311 RepID=UPI002F35E411